VSIVKNTYMFLAIVVTSVTITSHKTFTALPYLFQAKPYPCLFILLMS